MLSTLGNPVNSTLLLHANFTFAWVSLHNQGTLFALIFYLLNNFFQVWGTKFQRWERALNLATMWKRDSVWNHPHPHRGTDQIHSDRFCEILLLSFCGHLGYYHGYVVKSWRTTTVFFCFSFHSISFLFFCLVILKPRRPSTLKVFN